MAEKTNRSDICLVICPAWGATQPPVGISYLKGFLSSAGINVRCLDLSLDLYKNFPEKKYWDLNYPEYFMDQGMFKECVVPSLEAHLDRWVEQILSFDPKVVGLSLFMSSVNVSLLLAQRLKSAAPDMIIIAGGAEATRIKRVLVDGINEFFPCSRDIISRNIFDALVDGEGEYTLLELFAELKKAKDYHKIKGLVYVEEGRLVANQPRELIKDLDELPLPDYSDFPLDEYTRQAIPIVTSRGCINRCTFCADSPLWKVYRCHSAEHVVDGLKALVEKYKRREFEMVDSIFNGDIKRLHKICDLIIEAGLDIIWSAKAALRRGMDYTLLKKMKKAGCNSLAYGVESGSERVLKDMCKNIDLSEARRVIRETHQAGIDTNCFFVIGHPTETEEDFQLTLDFLKENAEFIHRFDQITGCHLEEDSYLGRNLDKYGIKLERDGWQNACSSPQIRKERLERFRQLARQLHKHYKCEVQS